MSKVSAIRYMPVETIPRTIDDGVLYVSEKFGTAIHMCCCGCGNEVVTPLGPTDWKVEVDGDAVSLYPSVGNWSLACRSHYWIKGGEVVWAEQWSRQRIEYGRQYDWIAKQRQYGEPEDDTARQEDAKPGIWARFWRWLKGS